jgi:site-specific recombinase XerC
MKTLSRQHPVSKASPRRNRPQKLAEHTLTTNERRAFFRTIKKHRGALAKRDYHLFRFVALQGLRVGSLAQITCGDVRDWLASSQMRIRNEIAKAGKGYTAPLRAEAREDLRALERLRENHPDPLPTDCDALFLWSQRGAGMSPRTIQQRMQKWRELAGLSVAASPHWLRHGLAYELRASANHANRDAVVARMLGQSVESTSRIYGQPSRQELADAIPKANL